VQTTMCVPTDTRGLPELGASTGIWMHNSMAQTTPKQNQVSRSTHRVPIARATADMPVLRSGRVDDTNPHIDNTQAHLKSDQDPSRDPSPSKCAGIRSVPGSYVEPSDFDTQSQNTKSYHHPIPGLGNTGGGAGKGTGGVQKGKKR
jgi:hypothetical protein